MQFQIEQAMLEAVEYIDELRFSKIAERDAIAAAERIVQERLAAQRDR